MSSLRDKNLLATSTNFPNQDNTFIGGIFIKKWLEGVNKHFSKVNIVVPVTRRWGVIDRAPYKTNYNYENINVIFSKPFFVPRAKIKKLQFDKWHFSVNKAIQRYHIDFDIIHAHYGVIGRSCVRIAEKYGKPLITSFYGHDAYRKIFDSRYYNLLFQRGRFFITLSNHMSNHLEKLGCPRQKIVKIHIGIDTDYFSPVSKDQNTTSIKLLLVANFTEKKGILNAIKAFSRIKKDNLDIHFDIVGDGYLKPEIEKLILKLGLRDNITLVNNKATPNPRQTVRKFMQQCDIFILPSITAKSGDSEGTPVVLMEASSCGKPCITTDHSGNPEVVLNNETGFVVPENDIEGLTNSIRTLIDEKDLRIQFGKNARNHILKEFNAKIQTKKLLQLYEEIST